MMLYLTGASASIDRSGGNSPQPDVNKSLGGYISTSPVPNNELNSLFDEVSLLSVQNGQTETIALGLINEFDYPVEAKIRIITKKRSKAKFEVAVVEANGGSMERIGSRYSQPLHAEFHKADFSRASVSAKIEQYAGVGEQMLFTPFGVTATAKKASWDGTWNAIRSAFEGSEYKVTRKSIKGFVIERLADDVVTSEPCRVVSTGASRIKFFSDLKNDAVGEAYLGIISPGQSVGVWLKREINKKVRSNDQIILDSEVGYIEQKEELVEFVIDYEPHVIPEP